MRKTSSPAPLYVSLHPTTRSNLNIHNGQHGLPGMDCTLVRSHLTPYSTAGYSHARPDHQRTPRQNRRRLVKVAGFSGEECTKTPFFLSCSRTDIRLQNHLRELQLDRRNIVLDSARPDLSPHIVITPPDSVDAWNNYWASCVNRPGPQDPAYLALLPRSDGLDPLASAPPPPPSAVDGRGAREATGATTPDDAQSEHRALFLGEPRRVYSKSRFRSKVSYILSGFPMGCSEPQVACAAQERDMLFLHNISTAVHRRNLRLAVSNATMSDKGFVLITLLQTLEAASTAPSFRTRWDAPNYMRRLERPFQWTDEAEVGMILRGLDRDTHPLAASPNVFHSLFGYHHNRLHDTFHSTTHRHPRTSSRRSIHRTIP